MLTYKLTSAYDTEQLGHRLAVVLSAGTIIYLQGDLGAGKTTFVRGVLRGLGFEGRVKSPTFTLVETYDTTPGVIVHTDLYRLEEPAQCETLGFREYNHEQAVFFIEWPEKGEGYLPKPDVIFDFQVIPEGRVVSLEAKSTHGAGIISALS